MKKALPLVLKVLISTGLLTLLLIKANINLKTVWGVLTGVPYWVFPVVMMLALSVLLVKSARWRWLIGGACPLGQGEAFRYYLDSFALGVVTPGRLGEFFKTYQLYHLKKVSLQHSFVSVLSDRFFDLFILVWLGGVGLLHWLLWPSPSSIWWILAGVLLMGLLSVAVAVFLLSRLTPILKKWRVIGKLLVIIGVGITPLIRKKGLPAWGLSVVGYLLYFYSNYLILHACGVKLDFPGTCFLFSAVGLVLLLPISIAGMGTREATMILLLQSYHFADSDIIAASLFQFLVYFICCGALGMLSLLGGNYKIRALCEELQKLRVAFKKGDAV